MTERLHRSPPFRAEHMGSLLRPESLHPDNKSKLDPAQLTAVEDRAIDDIVKLQLDCGLRGIGDGEFRRNVFWGTLFQNFEGMQDVTDPDPAMFRSFVAGFVKGGKLRPGTLLVCQDKLRHSGKSDYVKELRYLQQVVPRDLWGGIKITLPSPNWYHLQFREGYAYPKDVYRDDQEYFRDLAAAYRTELDLLYEAGLRNVQFDDPNLTFFCAEDTLQDWETDKANTRTPDELFHSYIKLYNDVLSSRPDDLHVGIHLCRGNFRHSSRKGGYERIAQTLFQELDVDTYYLEYDDQTRTGGFSPLKYLPRTKNVILGVVTSKYPELEDKCELKRRVFEAAESIAEGNGTSKEEALKQIGISPQCGFSSTVEVRNMGYEDMVRKMRLIREVADDIWPGEP
ncbi:hypothetical protein DTO164E3_8319 [Paecilomyces variotii]|nr:hypothetical protein DTO164E3_8319 [Paecilomyces variotii]KAJ9206190.1 hypothetical protein DTO032I3_2055 [Paecilomyces variotii]KAJ9281607.1 hypothetical protein DTO021D3_1373 [Paecilomyces variotii]KAJ9338608.1 hypothetical protein DTO027B6_8825 [Paecilomyces variotii]KAJ9392249.1 hypothetical protein DTO032I4_663 [Paecilomyces variotii]